MQKKCENIISQLNFSGDLFLDTDSSVDLLNLEFLLAKLSSPLVPLILNLEGSLRLKNSIINKDKAIPLSLSQSILSVLSKYNIIVSLANNHVTDFGEDSFMYLTECLDEFNIKWFGPVINGNINTSFIEIGEDKNGNPIFIVGCGWYNEQVLPYSESNHGCIDFEYKQLIEIFKHIIHRNNNSRVLLYAHVGYEYEYWPIPLHVHISRRLIDFGFEAIIGTHTHTIQAFELYKDSPIFYGLGNFYFKSKLIQHNNKIVKGISINLFFDNNTINHSSSIIKHSMKDNTISIATSKVNSSELPSDLSLYSRAYPFIRIRTINPRPILFPDQSFINNLKYLTWLFIVSFLGRIGCRKIVKTILWG